MNEQTNEKNHQITITTFWRNERMNEWMNEWMSEWMNKWVNEWMNEQMDKQIKEKNKNRVNNQKKTKWMNECPNQWQKKTATTTDLAGGVAAPTSRPPTTSKFFLVHNIMKWCANLPNLKAPTIFSQYPACYWIVMNVFNSHFEVVWSCQYDNLGKRIAVDSICVGERSFVLG